jgi:hypothetical protein
MGTLESQTKLIKAILEAPEESVSKIADMAGVALQTAYSNLEEMYNIYMNKVLAEEDDIPTSMASTFNGEVSPEEMIVVIEYLKKRNKKFNSKQESNNSTIDSMGSSDVSGHDSTNNTFDIDTDIKALQLVLEKYKNKTVSAERVGKVVDIYRAMEFKYKKNPFALRGLLVQVLGAGPGEMAFQDFIDMIKFYLPPAELAKFGLISPGQAGQQPFNTGGGGGGGNGGMDPMIMAMMSGGEGEINPMALAGAAGGGGGNNDWLQKLLIADYFEERRRKKQREEEEMRQKAEDRRLAAKREFEEAENRRMMTMMMMGMANKNGGDSSIPPGYTVRRTYDAAGKPIDEYIPISQTVLQGQNGGNNGNGGAEIVKVLTEALPKLVPQPQNNDFMQAMALKAIDKMNVQADPLESAARVMEVIERFKPAQTTPTVDPYEKIQADIAMLDKKMAWWEKEKNWEAQQMDKRIAQENTKSYIDTIERVLSNVGAPLVEKFASGMAARGGAVQTPPPPMSMPGQPPAPQQQSSTGLPPGMTEEEYFMSLPPEQLEEIAKQRDMRLAEFQQKNVALEAARRAKGMAGGQSQEQQTQEGNGNYFVNTGE